MFNGIIFKTGILKSIKKNRKSYFIGIQTKEIFKKISVLPYAVMCVLTLAEIKGRIIYFYISIETIKRSTFKNLYIGQIINLEKSLTYGQKISGHYIQGHVDTTAKIKRIYFVDKSWIIHFKLKDNNLKKFLEEKGSISINGVSLTISKVEKKYFKLNIIPHTLKLTNLKKLKVNDQVNVELDIFGKYIYKYSL